MVYICFTASIYYFEDSNSGDMPRTSHVPVYKIASLERLLIKNKPYMRTIIPLFTRPALYMLIVLTGAALKFYHLDHKLLWIDEIYAIQHTSGRTGSEYLDQIPVDEVRNCGFYRDIFSLNKQDSSLWVQMSGLLASTQLNPLHYPLLMVWYRIVGDEPVHFRLFSVFVFILTLPVLFLPEYCTR